MQQIIAYEQNKQGEKKGTLLKETSNSISDEVTIILKLEGLKKESTV